jgi:hypothetical protein
MPFNFGAFAGGLGQGLQRGQAMALQAQEHKLKSEMIKNQLAKDKLAQQEADQQSLELGKYVEMGTKGVQQEVTPGYESPEQQMSVAPVNQYRPATPQEMLGQGLKSVPPAHRYNLIEQSMKEPRSGAQQRQMSVGTGGSVWDPVQGKEVYRNPTERVGVGVESQMLLIARKIQNGTASPEETSLYNAWPDRIKLVAEKRGEGAKQGGLNVEQTPEFQANVKKKSQAAKTGSNIAEAQEQLPQLAGAMGLVNELDVLSKNIFTTSKQSGWLQRGTAAVGEYGRSWDPSSMEGMYEARKQTVGENLARQIGGVKGTATEGDIYRMLVALPKVGRGETAESRAYKIGAFREAIQLAINNKERFIRGEPINLEESRRQFKALVDRFVEDTGGGAPVGKPAKLRPLPQ